MQGLEGHTNIYTVFMALSLSLLAEHGRACFIIPRSFCSGAYFSAFRQALFDQIVPLRLHLFESRGEVFKAGSVLQENLIFTFRKRQAAWEEAEIPQTYLSMSTSQDASDLPLSDVVRPCRRVNLRHFLGDLHGRFFFRLPTSELDERILDTVDHWPGSLAHYGLKISTGPIVAFRAKDQLTDVALVK
jgi:adenine-specific DNA-methyltransferase